MKVLGTSLALLLLVVASSAFADGRGVDDAVAAFERGEKLMGQKRFAEACAEYTNSYALDPQLGVLLHVADCNEQLGKFASAYKAFQDGHDLALKKGDPRSKVAKERAGALAGRLSFILVVPKEPVSGLQVNIDAGAIEPGAIGQRVPVDPGRHVVKAAAPGRQDWETEVTAAGEGVVTRVEIPPLEPTAVAPPQAPVAPDADAGLQVGPGPSFQKIAGWTAVGLGAVGLGLSGYFFADKASKASDAADVEQRFHDTCAAGGVGCEIGSPLEVSTNAQLDTLHGEEESARTAGIVAAVSGGVFLTTGLVLLLTVPSKESPPSTGFMPVLGPGVAMLGYHVSLQ